jgi:2-polyprenyl-3-methyl-5-hydroxy-6-metoxy-1,4-benzoquinol methylase
MEPQHWEFSRCSLCGDDRIATLFTVTAKGENIQAHVVRCQCCGLRRLHPRPRSDAIGRYYAADYSAYAGRTRSRRKQLVWDALRDASSRPGTTPWGRLGRVAARAIARRKLDTLVGVDHSPRVLDFGCGFGDLLIYLKSRGCSVRGVDFDERAAQAAASYGVDVHVGALDELPEPHGTFDDMVMSHSLEHVHDPRATLSAAARFVRPGGRLHIAVPNGAARALALQGQGWFHLSFPLHLWFYDERTLRRLCDEHGFEVIDTRHRMTWPAHVRRWRSGAGSAAREAPTLVLTTVFAPRRRDVLAVVARRRDAAHPQTFEVRATGTVNDAPNARHGVAAADGLA